MKPVNEINSLEYPLNKNSRLVVFAHFNSKNKVKDSVFIHLQDLKKISRTLIFVSASSLPKVEKVKLEAICSGILVRENKMMDFGSYQAGLDLVNLEEFEEVVLCNDSCIGPFKPAGEIFKEMEQFKKVDFWGITFSFEIKFHIQSYFLVFRKPVVRSKTFLDFWSQKLSANSKEELIAKYEVGLSRALIESGFKPGTVVGRQYWFWVRYGIFTLNYLSAYFLQQSWVDRFQLMKEFFYYKVFKLAKTRANRSIAVSNSRVPYNISIFMWKECLKFGSPFLKRSVLKNSDRSKLDFHPSKEDKMNLWRF